MTKTKILYIHHGIGMGGAPRSLSFLISSLDKNEFEPIVLMAKRPKNEEVSQLFADAGAEIVEEQNIRPFNGSTVAPCNTLKQAAYYLAAAMPTFFAARKHIRRIKPDLVHLNSTCMFMAAAGSKWASRKTKTVVHVREPLQLNWWGKMLAFMNRRYTDAFVSIDHYGLETIGVIKQPGYVIPNFVDRDVYKPGVSDRSYFRDQFNCQPKDVLFLSMARVAPSNGSLEFAKLIAAEQKNISPLARFAICGFADVESDYSRQTRAAIDACPQSFACDFTSNVVESIDASDVIVAPFVTPHNARMVIEGSAMEKPCLVSDVANLKEQIIPEESGLVFSFDRPDELIQQINSLCENPELRQKMGKAAGEFAANNYDKDTNSRRTIEVYREMLSGQQTR